MDSIITNNGYIVSFDNGKLDIEVRSNIDCSQVIFKVSINYDLDTAFNLIKFFIEHDLKLKDKVISSIDSLDLQKDRLMEHIKTNMSIPDLLSIVSDKVKLTGAY